MTYYFRTLAAAYLFSWMLYATFLIGTGTSSKAISWVDAWAFVDFLALAMWLGWKASKEHEQKP